METFGLAKPAVSRRTVLALGASVGGVMGVGRASAAADYPARPIRIIVPYTPGGTTDIATRLVAEPLSKVEGIASAVMQTTQWVNSSGTLASPERSRPLWDARELRDPFCGREN